MKLAILLLCHKNAEQINLLLEQLAHPDISVFVHIDKRSSIEGQLISRPNVWLLPSEKRVACQWGRLSLVEATLNLLQYATQQGTFDYFWLCSGQDFPIKPTSKIISFLRTHQGYEFIDLFPSKYSMGHYSNYDKRTDLYYPSWILGNQLWQRVLKRGYIELMGGYNQAGFIKRKNLMGLRFYFGSQWWCLSRDVVGWLLDYVFKNPQYIEFFKNSMVPDECFFHTLVMNSPYAKNHTTALHYIDWSEHKNSPKTLTMIDLPALQKSPRLMARKFDCPQDMSFLKKIVSMIGEKTL